MDVTVACLNCGQGNRIPTTRVGADPKCGTCGAPLVKGVPTDVSLEVLKKAARLDTVPLVVDFWAAWCGPCRAMPPEFAKPQQTHARKAVVDAVIQIRRRLALPDDTRVFVGHDYAPDGRDAECEATVAEHKAANIHFRDAPNEAAYRAVRDARDATLPLPKLMLAALQVNIRGGRLPEPVANGRSYLKVPLNQFDPR